jgi:hypothetical protein
MLVIRCYLVWVSGAPLSDALSRLASALRSGLSALLGGPLALFTFRAVSIGRFGVAVELIQWLGFLTVTANFLGLVMGWGFD